MPAVHSTPHPEGSVLRFRLTLRSGRPAAAAVAVLLFAAPPPRPNEKAIKLPASCFGSPVSLMALYDLTTVLRTGLPSQSRC